VSAIATARRVLDLDGNGTPGPFRACPSRDSAGFLVADCGDQWIIETAGATGDRLADGERDAAMIAEYRTAAPELAKFVGLVSREIQSYRKAHEKFLTPSSAAVYAAMTDLLARLGLPVPGAKP
jgi:hypothetical protein